MQITCSIRIEDLMSETPIDTSNAHTARVWNYWLGGKDNYPADREVGDKLRKLFPGVVEAALGDREFLRRVVTHLVEEKRSEEHTSELQSRGHLVCRLLLEKKKQQRKHGQRIR